MSTATVERWEAIADSQAAQIRALHAALRQCKAAVENGNLPPSARMELVRDTATPILEAYAPAALPRGSGPWTVEPAKGTLAAWLIADAVGLPVAWIAQTGRNDTDRANALLAAASPKLLSALHSCLVWMEDQQSDEEELEHALSGHDPEGCCLCLARDAVKAATLEEGSMEDTRRGA